MFPRQGRFVAIAQVFRLADSTIAELEAEMAREREQAEAWHGALVKSEAELAEMKARRCETCACISNCYVFDRAVNHTEPYFGTFACNRWEAK